MISDRYDSEDLKTYSVCFLFMVIQ